MIPTSIGTDTWTQMRRLDRVREGMLCKVWSSFANLLSLKLRQKWATEDGRILGGAVGTPRPTKRRFKGKPFSYCGFLENVVRPTSLRAMRYGGKANMARRRRRVLLAYSEL